MQVVVLMHRNTNPLRVPLQMLQEMYHLATSRACITDSYMAAISVLRHKPSLTVVQMWHALGAIKRFGLASLDTEEGRSSRFAAAMRMHQGYDWVIAGGTRMVQPFAEAFGVDPSHVLPIGTPRVDLLLDPANVAGQAPPHPRGAPAPRRPAGGAVRTDVPQGRAGARRRPARRPRAARSSTSSSPCTRWTTATSRSAPA